MKITAIETITFSRGLTVHAGAIDWLWVRIHTDPGLTGLGETYPLAAAEKAGHSKNSRPCGSRKCSPRTTSPLTGNLPPPPGSLCASVSG